MPKAKRTTKGQLARKKKTYTKFLAVFSEELELKAFECNKEIAREYAKEARDVIEGQRYRWHPLSEPYLEAKIIQGYDPRIYVRTSEFLQAISWGVTHGKVWTGIPSRVMHTGKLERADAPVRKPIPMILLARWLEFGATQTRQTSGGNVYNIILPPRPIWRPLLSKYIRLKPKFGKRYRKALDKAVKRRTGVK
jgi:hypothetical protein